MHRDAGSLADGHQARHDPVGIAIDLGEHFAVVVRGYAAHVVMDGRQHRDRLARHVDAGEDAGAFRDTRQALGEDRRVQVVEVEIDVVLELADATSFADLHGHGAGDDVAAGKILGRRGVALHEALALGVGEIAAFTTRSLGDQAAGAIDAGRVELNELHILQGKTGAQHHGIAVTGAGMGRGTGEIGAAVTAGRQHCLVGAEAVDRTGFHVQGDHAAAGTILHDQVNGEILDEELRRMPERLAVHGVQHGMTGTVGSGAGTLGDALAKVGRHAAERPLVDLAFLGTGEGHAPVLELIDGSRRVAHQILNGILVAQPVGPLDGVVHVPAPVVRPHVAERSGNAALGGHGMRAGGKHLGDAGRRKARFRGADNGPEAGTARADHHHVEGMVDELVGTAADVEGGLLAAGIL